MIVPKNWREFQHYSDRKPAWIKLHKALLDDYAFACLPVASRALAPCLWLLASEYNDGEITASHAEIAFRLRMPERELLAALKPLIDAGFFIDSEPLAKRLHDACLEKEEQEEIQVETEKNIVHWPSDFREQFWREYPLKKGKQGALKALDSINKRRAVPWEKLISAVRAYAATADPEFTKHPQTWLNKGCWDDEPDERKIRGKSPILAALDGTRERIRSLGLCNGAGADHARLLPQGRSERPADVLVSGSCTIGAISEGGNRRSDASIDRDAQPDRLHADAEGTEGRTGTGNGPGHED